MKQKLLSIFILLSILITSIVAPFKSSMVYASENTSENSSIMIEDTENIEDRSKSIENKNVNTSNENQDLHELESPINNQSIVEKPSKENFEQEDLLDKEVQNQTVEQEEESEKIIGKSVYAEIYEDSSYTNLSSKNISIKITGLMPESAVIKAYLIDQNISEDDKEPILSFAFNIFDNKGNLYPVNMSDEYRFEIDCKDFKDNERLFLYKKNETSSEFIEKISLFSIGNKVEFSSRPFQYLILKEKDKIESKEVDKDTNILEKLPNIKDEDTNKNERNYDSNDIMKSFNDYNNSREKPEKNITSNINFEKDNAFDLRSSLIQSIEDEDKKEDLSEENDKFLKESDLGTKSEEISYQQILADIYKDENYSISTNDGSQIKISGKLPEGVKVKAYPVDIAIEGQDILAAYDITIFDKNKQEYKVTSENNIEVQINNPKIKETEKVEVYHKEDVLSAEERINVDNKRNSTVTFSADSFSIYAITDPKAQATRTYEFWILDNDGNKKELINTQTIRSGESLQKPPVPILNDRGRYAGWYPINSQKNENDEIHFFQPIYFDNKTPEKIELTPLFLDNVYIDFKERVYITEKNKADFSIPPGYTLDSDGYYKDSNGKKLYRDEVFKTRVQDFNVPIGEAHIPVVMEDSESVLSYWSINPEGGEAFNFQDTPISKELIQKQEAISKENQSSRLDLFAIFEPGYTINFDSDGGSHVTRLVIKKDQKIDSNKITEPIKPGYKFIAWSLTKGGDPIKLENIDVNKSMTLYALYEKLPGTYTVSHYTENIDDNKYVFYKSETKTAQVGSKTPNGEYFRNQANSDIAKDLIGKGYTKPTEIAPSDPAKIVKADGSTDIKIYYRRPRYKLNVYTTGIFQSVGTYRFTEELKEGQDTAPVWKRAEQLVGGRYEVREGSLSGETLKTPENMPARTLNLYFVPTLGSSEWFVKFIEVDQNDNVIKDESGNPRVIKIEAHNAIIVGAENYTGGAKVPGFEFRYVTQPGQYSDYPKVYNSGEAREVRTFYKRQSYQLKFKTNNILYPEETRNVPFYDKVSSYVPTKITPGMIDKNGAVFKGWYDNPDFTGVPVDFTNIRMPAKDITYHGKWEQEKYTVRIYKEMTTPGQISSPDKMTEFFVDRNTKLSADDSRLVAIKPDKIKNNNNVKLTWYRFSGSQFEPYDFSEPITQDIFLYPVWQYYDSVTESYRPLEEVHTITYTDGKNSFKDNNLYLNNAAAILKPPYALDDPKLLSDPKNLNDKYFGDFIAPDGKHFQGWLLNNDPSRIYRPGEVINVTSDMTFYAKWGEYDKTSIKYYEQRPGTDKKSSKTEDIRENGSIKLPSLSEPGWKFLGWSKKPEGPKDFDPNQEVMVTNENLPNELYGIWEKQANLIKIVNNVKDDTGTEENLKVSISYSLGKNKYNDEYLIPNGSIEKIEIPFNSQNIKVTAISNNNLRYKYKGETYTSNTLELSSLTDDIEIVFENQQAPVPTGIIDNIAPMTLMLALATMAFAYSLYKKIRIVGGMDEWIREHWRIFKRFEI